MKTPKVWIIDIIEASNSINRLLKGYDFEKFKGDERTYLAITKLIENVGEACNHLVEEFQQDYPEIPWRKIVAMRNRTVHEYWDIDYQLIWKSATEEVPTLKSDLKPILENLQRNEK